MATDDTSSEVEDKTEKVTVAVCEDPLMSCIGWANLVTPLKTNADHHGVLILSN